MKFGLLFHLQDPPNGDHIARLYDEVFAQAQFAEQLGFEAFSYPNITRCRMATAAVAADVCRCLAAKTQRAKSAPACRLPLFHPLQLPTIA
jgi:hypothetical protein